MRSFKKLFVLILIVSVVSTAGVFAAETEPEESIKLNQPHIDEEGITKVKEGLFVSIDVDLDQPLYLSLYEDHYVDIEEILLTEQPVDKENLINNLTSYIVEINAVANTLSEEETDVKEDINSAEDTQTSTVEPEEAEETIPYEQSIEIIINNYLEAFEEKRLKEQSLNQIEEKMYENRLYYKTFLDDEGSEEEKAIEDTNYTKVKEDVLVATLNYEKAKDTYQELFKVPVSEREIIQVSSLFKFYTKTFNNIEPADYELVIEKKVDEDTYHILKKETFEVVLQKLEETQRKKNINPKVFFEDKLSEE